jgi:hypothetical protein
MMKKCVVRVLFSLLCITCKTHQEYDPRGVWNESALDDRYNLIKSFLFAAGIVVLCVFTGCLKEGPGTKPPQVMAEDGATGSVNSYAQNEIVFWKYSKDLNFDDLQTMGLNELPADYEVHIRIPLDDFAEYFWDEQILRMARNVFDKKTYLERLRTHFFESDGNNLFFSIVIDDKIIMNGIDRTMAVSAEKKSWDDGAYPKLSMSIQDDSVYFRFVIVTSSFHSIWANDQGNISGLFNEDMYKYFLGQNKITRGKIDVPSIVHGVQMLK